MIPRTKLYSSFVQYGDTCILGSYAIVSNYYIGVPLLDFFKDFCKHFDIKTEENDFAMYFSKHFITSRLSQTQRLATWLSLTDLNKYEIAYDHFFHREYNSRNISGLNLMKEIHDISNQSSFESSRNLFSLSYIPYSGKLFAKCPFLAGFGRPMKIGSRRNSAQRDLKKIIMPAKKGLDMI